MRVGAMTAQDVISGWMDKPREGAEQMISKYGQPDEISNNMLVWHDKGPWRKIEIVNEQIPHNFPMPHQDFLYQAINYDVPEDKTCELASFDGSVLVDRTKGELAGRCHMEPMNILSLNLAVDIIEGKSDVEQARKKYAQIAQSFMQGKSDPYTQDLQFRVPSGKTGDPDKAMK